MDDKPRKLTVDMPIWKEGIHVDDFLVAVGQKKSNSVYHVAESVLKKTRKERIVRYHLKVFRSDLLTALQRDPVQQLVPFHWYRRSKKKK